MIKIDQALNLRLCPIFCDKPTLECPESRDRLSGSISSPQELFVQNLPNPKQGPSRHRTPPSKPRMRYSCSSCSALRSPIWADFLEVTPTNLRGVHVSRLPRFPRCLCGSVPGSQKHFQVDLGDLRVTSLCRQCRETACSDPTYMAISSIDCTLYLQLVYHITVNRPRTLESRRKNLTQMLGRKFARTNMQTWEIPEFMPNPQIAFGYGR